MTHRQIAVGSPHQRPGLRRAFVAIVAALLLLPALGVTQPAAATGTANVLISLEISGIGGLTVSYNGATYTFENATGGTRQLGGYTVPEGTVVTLTPVTPLGQEFLGWNVAGSYRNWASSLPITVTGPVHVGATFQAYPTFTDVPAGPRYASIYHLAARNQVRGYGDGRFGPSDTTQRAQMAALIARAMGWDGQRYEVAFTDRCNAAGCVADELWANVSALAYYNVARGYTPTLYGPFDHVTLVQTISFITRAMVARGYWANQPEVSYLYPNVPASSGHRQDLATYYHYAGAVPIADMFASLPLPGWDQPTTRATFADILWQALDRTFSRPESRYYPDQPLP